MHTPFCSDDGIFGEKLFVLGGDFGKILPAVPKAGRELIVASSLPWSSISRHCQVLNLRINMPVLSSTLPPQMRQEYQNFASWIISVGEGYVSATKI